MAQFPEGSFADEHVCSNVQPYIEMSMSLTGNEWHKHTFFLILKLLFSYNVRLRSKRWFKCTQGERGNETASECEKKEQNWGITLLLLFSLPLHFSPYFAHTRCVCFLACLLDQAPARKKGKETFAVQAITTYTVPSADSNLTRAQSPLMLTSSTWPPPDRLVFSK